MKDNREKKGVAVSNHGAYSNKRIVTKCLAYTKYKYYIALLNSGYASTPHSLMSIPIS